MVARREKEESIFSAGPGLVKERSGISTGLRKLAVLNGSS